LPILKHEFDQHPGIRVPISVRRSKAKHGTERRISLTCLMIALHYWLLHNSRTNQGGYCVLAQTAKSQQIKSGIEESEVGIRPSLKCLLLAFLRLGASAFGGPSMVAYIGKMAVEKKRWMSRHSFMEGVALCQLIPGATAMQTSAYVGLKTHGVMGAAASFIGFGFPAFLLMMALSVAYAHMHNLPVVVSVFQGLQAIIVAIVANATLVFGRNSLKNGRDVIIAVVAALMFGNGVNPIVALLVAAALGLARNVKTPARCSIIEPSGRSGFPTALLILVAAAAAGFGLLFRFERKLFDLVALMSTIDLFAFGGGFASIPLMFHEIVHVQGWMDGPTFLNGIVLGQITPGPIVITATFVGYAVHGLAGGLLATVGIFLPSFLLVVGIAPLSNRMFASSYLNKALGGVLCSFVGLLLTVTARFALNVQWNLAHILLGGAAFVALLLNVDILWVVLVGALISMIAR
jgi:chromate transporter